MLRNRYEKDKATGKNRVQARTGKGFIKNSTAWHSGDAKDPLRGSSWITHLFVKRLNSFAMM